MTYELIFDEKAIRFLEKLDAHKKQRIFKKIISTKKEPYRYFMKLKGHNVYRLAVGDYRVIADINDKKQKIIVLLIGHRRNIYK